MRLPWMPRVRGYTFENTEKGLKLVADYYASVGKLGIEKATEGDQRTPLGVYFITSRLGPRHAQGLLRRGCPAINYPNPLQVRARPAAASGCTARRPTSFLARHWPPMAA